MEARIPNSGVSEIEMTIAVYISQRSGPRQIALANLVRLGPESAVTVAQKYPGDAEIVEQDYVGTAVFIDISRGHDLRTTSPTPRPS